MKTSKRILALTMALLMIVALSACGGKKNELLGTWSAEVDMAPIMVKEVDDSVDLGD